MIYFNTSRLNIYNKIIHNYLEVEIFGDPDLDIGDIIECYMPKYLFREQYQKCISVFKDLHEWTIDPFLHELTAFYEVALFYFLQEMEEIKNDMNESFINVFYDKDMQKEIKKYIKQDLEENGNDIDILQDNYYSPISICDIILEDLDFLELPLLYNENKLNLPIMSQLLGINLDYYFEILPMDIQNQYKSKHITLTGEVSDFFDYLQSRITSGSLAELFWDKDTPF